MNEKISIIVPVYNSELYLQECLQSIEMQTYHNLEIILIYTPSKDESYEICRRHMEKDLRYKMIVNEEAVLGAAYARNLGLEQVTGTYLGFVDSDDVIATDMFETLLFYMKKHDADMSICQETRKRSDLQSPVGNETVFSGREAQRNLMIGKYYYGELWNKLYKWELIQRLRFRELKVAEDICFVWQALEQTQKVVFISAPRYFYRCNTLGLTHQCSEIHYQNTMDVFRFMMETLNRNNSELIGLLEYRELIVQAQSFINAKLNKKKELAKEIHRSTKKVKNVSDIKKEFKTSERWIAQLYQVHPDMAYMFYRLYRIFCHREK